MDRYESVATRLPCQREPVEIVAGIVADGNHHGTQLFMPGSRGQAGGQASTPKLGRRTKANHRLLRQHEKVYILEYCYYQS
jgi:hypothetical protein